MSVSLSSKEAESIFKEHFSQAYAILKQSDIELTQQINLEIYAVMFVITDFTSSISTFGRKIIDDTVLSHICKNLSMVYRDLPLSELKKRVVFYGDVIDGLHLHAHALMGRDVSDAHPVLRCTVAFADCCLNPSYIDDYRAPAPVLSALDVFDFSADTMEPLSEVFSSLYQQLADCSLLLSSRYSPSHQKETTSSTVSHRIQPQAASKPQNVTTSSPDKQFNTNLIPIFALLIFVGVIVFLIHVAIDSAGTAYTPEQVTEATTEEVFDQPKQIRPSTGQVFHQPTGEKLAPLEIITDNSDTDGGYYFILQPITGSDKNKIVFFVRAGDTFKLDVPLGNYYLYYAYGEYWYGEDYLFGPETIYQKCDDEFRFYESLTGYNGYTLTLYPVINGNLDTDVIPEDEFPK